MINYFKEDNERFKFLLFINSFAVLFAILVYWRQCSVREQITFYHVLIWQVAIWLSWIFAFPLFEKVIEHFNSYKYRNIIIYFLSVCWISLHFAWFDFISSNYSPYLGQPLTNHGVYGYFFIFWTIIDIGLVWFVLEKINKSRKVSKNIVQKDLSEPAVFELTRGDKTYFCEPEQINWLAAENYYTKFHTVHGEFLIRKSLKNCYQSLSLDAFKRIHRSTIVNVGFISAFSRGKNSSMEVVLKDGTRRSVSRNHIKDIKLYFQEMVI